MLFNSKGKLFGKVSIVDILVILLVIVAVIGAYFRFKGNNVVAVNESCDFYYTVTVREIRETNKDLLEESIGTDFRLGGKVSSSMGTLQDVVVTEAIREIEKNDSSIVSAAVPNKYDVVLTFKVNGYKSDSGYFTPEMHEICVGKQYTVTNIYCYVDCYVDKIWTE